MIPRTLLLAELAVADYLVGTSTAIPDLFSESYADLMKQVNLHPTGDGSKSLNWGEKDDLLNKYGKTPLTFLVPIKIDDKDNQEEPMDKIVSSWFDDLDDEEKLPAEKLPSAGAREQLKPGQASSEIETYKSSNEDDSDKRVIHVVPPQDGTEAWGSADQLIGRDGQKTTLLAYYNSMMTFIEKTPKKGTLVMPLLGAMAWNAPEKQKDLPDYRAGSDGSGQLFHKELGTMLVAYMCLPENLKKQITEADDNKQKSFAIWEGLEDNQFDKMTAPGNAKGLGMWGPEQNVYATAAEQAATRAEAQTELKMNFLTPQAFRDDVAPKRATFPMSDQPFVAGAGPRVKPTAALVAPIAEFPSFDSEVVKRAAMRVVRDLDIVSREKIIKLVDEETDDIEDEEFVTACKAYMDKQAPTVAPAVTPETEEVKPEVNPSTPTTATTTEPTAGSGTFCTQTMIIISVVVVLLIGASVVVALVLCGGEEATE